LAHLGKHFSTGAAQLCSEDPSPLHSSGEKVTEVSTFSKSLTPPAPFSEFG
jgi:hypothetical protein